MGLGGYNVNATQRQRLGAYTTYNAFAVEFYSFWYCVYCISAPSLYRESTNSRISAQTCASLWHS